ncbi:hypothetical protein, partial [Stenotrophomonas maltophilia group sp. RNC7]|uniref:hypothetical protein n=1 Tax=Stenotrophomonas maltophilia group sp. RNC7 TaxID=3071467 RepID=UPI0027DF355F
DLLSTWFDGYDYDTEDKTWDTALEILSPDKIYDIIENINSYTKTYNEIAIPIDAIKHQSLKLFARLA